MSHIELIDTVTSKCWANIMTFVRYQYIHTDNCVFLVLFTWFWEMSSSLRGYDFSIRQIRYSDSKMAEIRCRMTHRQTPTRSWHIHTDQWSLLWILSLLSNLEPALLNPAEEGSIFLLVLTVNIHTAQRPGKYQPESALLHFSLFSSSLLTYFFFSGTLMIFSLVVSSKSLKTRNVSQNLVIYITL